MTIKYMAQLEVFQYQPEFMAVLYRMNETFSQHTQLCKSNIFVKMNMSMSILEPTTVPVSMLVLANVIVWIMKLNVLYNLTVIGLIKLDSGINYQRSTFVS